jgi:hypothetical protein
VSAECRRCERKCELFICPTCIENLRAQLRDLPWWLDRLIETALGQVRLSDGGRHSRRQNTLHGDDTLASHIEPYPNENEVDLNKARHQRQRAALQHALAAGRVNARASDEYQRIHNMLTSWVQDVCETRGVDTPRLSTSAAMARWLGTHANAIASQEDAGQFCDDVALIAKTVERIVNRPVPPRFIGPCITDPAPEDLLAERREAGESETRCNHALTANRKAAQVTCPTCKQTYEVEQLIAQLYDESRDMLVTVRDLVDWVLPKLDEPVPQRTLEGWIKRGELEVRGHGPHGAQMVRLGDVRDMRAKRPRHAKQVG